MYVNFFDYKSVLKSVGQFKNQKLYHSSFHCSLVHFSCTTTVQTKVNIFFSFQIQKVEKAKTTLPSLPSSLNTPLLQDKKHALQRRGRDSGHQRSPKDSFSLSLSLSFSFVLISLKHIFNSPARSRHTLTHTVLCISFTILHLSLSKTDIHKHT